MERHVYRPPRGSRPLNITLAILGGVFLTVAVFYVIPLMKRLEAALRPPKPPAAEELTYEEPPEEFVPEEEPPPEEEVEEPPEMEEPQQDLDLALDLPDLSAGIGGAMILDINPKFDIRDNPDDLFEGGDLDQAPRAVTKFPPRYPASLLRRKVTGRSVVRAMVDENGTVGEVSIKEGSGHSEMDQAAMNAIKRWRYKPAIKDGRKVRAPVVQPFNFTIR